eukprot:6284355-Pyramimonas_sp.AAC.1
MASCGPMNGRNDRNIGPALPVLAVSHSRCSREVHAACAPPFHLLHPLVRSTHAPRFESRLVR